MSKIEADIIRARADTSEAPMVYAVRGSARCWGMSTWSGGVPGSHGAGLNISSITDAGTGLLNINLAAAMTSHIYSIVATICGSGVANNMDIETRNGSITSMTYPIRTMLSTGTIADPYQVSHIAMGDLA